MRPILLLLVLCLAGCADLNLDVHQSSSGPSRENYCKVRCQKVYGTDLDYVGGLTGDCYCK